MSSNKKAIDLEGYFSRNRGLLESLDNTLKISKRGIGGDQLPEPIPEFVQAECETVHQGQNNSFIVLGRDRPASRLSGYGGSGDTQASMIDLVVGRMGSKPMSEDEQGNVVFTDPNFKVDAARIYISQKTDVDENFGLADGNVGNSKTKSAVGIKADGIRLVAREGIKLVTRTDKINSQGGEVKSVSGIDLIAGNDDKDLQPMAKGNNLAQALSRIVFHIDKLNGIVDYFLMQQTQFNIALTTHSHLIPILGTTLVSPTVVQSGLTTVKNMVLTSKVDLAKHKANLKTFKKTYLSKAGKKYINSKYNKVN